MTAFVGGATQSVRCKYGEMDHPVAGDWAAKFRFGPHYVLRPHVGPSHKYLSIKTVGSLPLRYGSVGYF